MLSVDECRKYLGGINLTDKQVQDLQEAIAVLVASILEEMYEDE